MDASAREIRSGDQVVVNFTDPGLPEGTTGTVVQVYEGIGDGLDLRLEDGRLINIMRHGVDLKR